MASMTFCDVMPGSFRTSISRSHTSGITFTFVPACICAKETVVLKKLPTPSPSSLYGSGSPPSSFELAALTRSPRKYLESKPRTMFHNDKGGLIFGSPIFFQSPTNRVALLIALERGFGIDPCPADP